MRKKKIHALHGFLGTPQDWTFFDHQFDGYEIVNYDLFNDLRITPFDNWAKHFNEEIKNDVECDHILLGYSLGGRLSMHALQADPKIWKAAIIVSAHIGLVSEKLKKERLLSDQAWAKRFLLDPWDQLMRDWNGREMFTTAQFTFSRKESSYNRERLAEALAVWSLGNQNEMTTNLSTLSLPILWIAGADDASYKDRAQKVTFQNPNSQVWIVSNSGHRVPWEKSNEFIVKVKQFLKDISE